MKYDPSNPPKYLRQTTTGRIYPFSTFKAARADMEAYEMSAVAEPVVLKVDAAAFLANAGSLNEEKTEALETMIDAAVKLEGLEEKSVEIPLERQEVIKAVIAQIPIENYGKPTMGKPALPKVKEVSDLAGFKVTADEILAIVASKE